MFKRPFNFKGRIGRSEYATSFLIAVLLLGLSKDFGIRGLPIMEWGIYIIGYWFLLAQGAKRCHDINKTGFLFLVPFVPIVLLFIPGTKGKNAYGDEPK